VQDEHSADIWGDHWPAASGQGQEGVWSGFSSTLLPSMVGIPVFAQCLSYLTVGGDNKERIWLEIIQCFEICI
jgi:hypothetical protein